VTEIDVNLVAGLSRRFRIVQRLGEGGMGGVFLAEQISVGNRPVALKVLLRTFLDNPDFLQRFQDEAASTGRIRHPNVVTIYESGQSDDGTPYIAMEYLEGETLRHALKARGALPVSECTDIIEQAAGGLNAAHKVGIIHRDLKPDNIFLARGDDGELVVKVVDFGIAKLRESATHTLTGTVLGTPAYMSFEQACGMKSDELDARSDIYSLGVVAYEMLTGHLPFESDTPVGYLRKHLQDVPPPFHSVKPDLPALPKVESVVMKALTKDRDQRYGSVLEFAQAFAQAAQPAPVGAVREAPLDKQATTVQPMAPPTTRLAFSITTLIGAPRSRPMLWVGALATALLLVAGSWYLFTVIHARTSPSPQPPSLLTGQTGVPQAAGTARVNPQDGLKYVWIPAGTFMMGCSFGDSECNHDEMPSHHVTISKGLWLGQTPVTVAAYRQFAGATKRAMPAPPDYNPGWGDQAMPIVNVRWDDAVAYCTWVGGRLPAEAEWEYAARAGSTQARYGPIDAIAWYADNSGRDRLDSTRIWPSDPMKQFKRLEENGDRPHEVAQKRPNAFNLYDMLGNVWEWVNDYYSQDYYAASPERDPHGPDTGQSRVIRGGSWRDVPENVVASGRARLDPNSGGNSFRCVRELGSH
jgi:serine/threonine-protein kinase